MIKDKRTVAGLLAVAALAIGLRVFAQPASTSVTGVCCLDDPISCIVATHAECALQGGIYGGDNSICFLNPFGGCTCGSGAGSCTESNGTPGCETLMCCEAVCSVDPFCCGSEWDENCATLASGFGFQCGALPCPDLELECAVSLQAHLNLAALGGGSSGNDCWGYVSPSGREYALMGVNNKLVVVEITTPNAPVVVASVSHSSSSWSDIKVYLDHAYVVNESGGGLDVIDLSNVDSGIVLLVQRMTTGGFQRSHNVAIDTGSGFLYLCGSNLNGGRLVAYDLSIPGSPTFVGQIASGVGTYVHDAEIVTFTSGPNAGKQIAFCGNGGIGLDIYDVTDKSNMFRLSRSTYPNLGYCHQVWLGEDGQFAYVNDETNGINETVVFDVSDLANPQLVGTYDSGVTAADHNLYVKGNFIFEAEYHAGLRIFCAVDDPINPVQVGWFDTYPANDTGGFQGAWSVYPFFPSGTVIISDTMQGLFVVDPSAALAACAAPCPWDCQAAPQSGAVDVPDLLALLGAWGGPQTPGTTCDLDGDGSIAVPDLLELLGNWGPCP